MPEEWTVSRPSGECSGCARAFTPGDEMLSALYQEQAELVRRDFCAPCWEKTSDDAACATAVRISFWRSIVPDPEDVEARKKRRLDAMLNVDVLLDIFKEMEDHPDPQRRRFRFVLGLMLMRRKKLKMLSIAKRKMADGPRDVLVLSTTGRKKKVGFDVVDVKMSEEEMISAQDEVGKLLAMGGVDDPGELPAGDA